MKDNISIRTQGMSGEVHPVLLKIVDILAEYGAWVIAEREQLESASNEEKQPMILQRESGEEDI